MAIRFTMEKSMRNIRTYCIVLMVVVLVDLIYNYSAIVAGSLQWFPWLLSVVLMTTVGFVGFRGLNYFYLRRILQWQTHTERSFFLFIIVSASFGALLMLVFMQLQTMVFHTATPSKDDYIRNMLSSAMFFLLITLGGTLGKFLQYWKDATLAAKHAEQLLTESQLTMLRNQVQPHFLFNTLNTLSSLIKSDQQKAVRFVLELSRILRYSLSQEQADCVLLKDELQVAQSYMHICQQRFGEKLLCEVDVEPIYSAYYIVSHSLLTALENAIKHNEISRLRPLKIRLYVRDNYIFVENNIQPLQSIPPSTHIGISNVMGRYKTMTECPVLVLSDNNYWNIGFPLMEHINRL